MTYVEPELWQPASGYKVEGTALEVVQSTSNLSVLAGPGAGKTEILAQRANYLLETGLCPQPFRILAISFKVDAARNLHNRVALRCQPEQAKRFESLTLDAFAKRIVDQFSEALPANLRPSSDYSILFPSRDIWNDFGTKYSAEIPEITSKSNSNLDQIVHQSIPCFHTLATSSEQKIRLKWWSDQLHGSSSFLTFDMIKLLASHILQSQPSILAALRQTYSYVFLDEFQDVTQRQYDLLKNAFCGSDSVVTAVGDTNQAIMRWAGAKADIFNQFESDFGASEKRLQFNYRSNSKIVALINDLTATIEPDFVPTECARQDEATPEDAVAGWVFETRQNEGSYLAKYIRDSLDSSDLLRPTDFVILARIHVDDVEKRLLEHFSAQGLKIRNEARQVGGIAIQDLVKEKAYALFFAAFKLAVNVREGQPFQTCRNILSDLQGMDINTERGHSDSLRAVQNLTIELEALLNSKSPSEVTGLDFYNALSKHASKVEFRRSFREYETGDRLNTVCSGFVAFFDECCSHASNWREVVEHMDGTNAVRLMTIHKSKGLEYHTVCFVEFNDDAFWGNSDDVNVFFVALSRAREKVLFSFTSDSRGAKNVKEFAKQLQNSGVSFVKKT